MKKKDGRLFEHPLFPASPPEINDKRIHTHEKFDSFVLLRFFSPHAAVLNFCAAGAVTLYFFRVSFVYSLFLLGFIFPSFDHPFYIDLYTEKKKKKKKTSTFVGPLSMATVYDGHSHLSCGCIRGSHADTYTVIYKRQYQSKVQTAIPVQRK
jgi:hypothetical protein